MANDLARWQFATTSIYHFFFVPVTIGLAFLVAVLQTVWYRTDNPEYKRHDALLRDAAADQRGDRRRHRPGAGVRVRDELVDVLAICRRRVRSAAGDGGHLAFFLESTFLGLWLFGWDRLPKRVHLACIWAVAVGSMLSAMFILIANSWMQHPVGYKINKPGQAVLTNVWALFVNPTFVWGYAHVILASLVTGCLVMLAVSAWYCARGSTSSRSIAPRRWR